MVAAIYTRLRATALRLINKYGRLVTLSLAADGPTPDPAKPWEPGAPTLTPHTLKAVVFPVEEDYVDGTTILSTDEQAIVAAAALPAAPDPKSVLVDGSTAYKTVKVLPIEPGEVPVIYTLFLRR